MQLKSLVALTQLLAIAAAAPADSTASSVATHSSSATHASSSATSDHSSTDSSAAAATTDASSAMPMTMSMASSGSASYDSASVASYYSSLHYDVVQFYKDFISSKDDYFHGHQHFFNTHTFTETNILNEITTYTDDSFTTLVNASPELLTVMASNAEQFPWFSSWQSKNQFVDLAQETANSAESAGAGPIAKSSMHLAMGVFAGVSGIFALSVW